MRKMRMICGILIVLFCVAYCDFAVAAMTDGIDRSLLKNRNE